MVGTYTPQTRVRERVWGVMVVVVVEMTWQGVTWRWGAVLSEGEGMRWWSWTKYAPKQKQCSLVKKNVKRTKKNLPRAQMTRLRHLGLIPLSPSSISLSSSFSSSPSSSSSWIVVVASGERSGRGDGEEAALCLHLFTYAFD